MKYYIDVMIRNTLGQVFTYHVAEKNTLGRYVSVPLRNRKKCLGIVIAEREDGYQPDFDTREATLFDDNRIVDSTAFELAREIAAHSYCTFPEAVELFVYDAPKSNRKLKEAANPKPVRKILTDEQLGAADRIWASEHMEHLLYGVTGSGKTEVYFELIKRSLEHGKRAMFLLPEISLTPQMTDRIKRAFNGSRIAVIHSKITEARRARYMEEIARGDVDIVLGARSAVLSPLRDIGVIIVDECHETSYRQDKRPRYDALRIARRLAELEGSKLVFGSATPNVDVFYNHGRSGTLTQLNSRYSGYAMPFVSIVDMRHESDKIISSQLHLSIEDRLAKREQTILFINRKGFSSIVQCHRCGYVFKCPNCEVAKTYYRHASKLCCNYCSHEESVPNVCPDCGGTEIEFSGLGTEKIEAEIAKRYPNASVARLDRSVVTSSSRVQEVVEAFESGEVDILIGTQMIAKGLDFPKVTLVGILAADLQLYAPDFLASERAFQLFTQVSGRAGRSGLRSEVIIQTYSPTHMAVSSRTYDEFYKKELNFRQKLGYPPYKSVLLMTFSDADERKAAESAYRTKQYLRKKLELASLNKSVKIFDEVPASIRRIENQFRYQVFVVSENEVFGEVARLVGVIEQKLKQTTGSHITVDLA